LEDRVRTRGLGDKGTGGQGEGRQGEAKIKEYSKHVSNSKNQIPNLKSQTLLKRNSSNPSNPKTQNLTPSNP